MIFLKKFIKEKKTCEKARIKLNRIEHEKALFSKMSVQMLRVIAKDHNIVLSETADKSQIVDIMFPFFSTYNIGVNYTKAQLLRKNKTQLRYIAKKLNIEFNGLRSTEIMIERLLPLVSKKTVDASAILPVGFLGIIKNKKTGYIRLEWWFRYDSGFSFVCAKKSEFKAFLEMHCLIWKTAETDVLHRQPLEQNAVYVPPVIASFCAANFLDLNFYYKVLNLYLTNLNLTLNSNINLTLYLDYLRVVRGKKRKYSFSRVRNSRKCNNFVELYCQTKNLQVSDAIYWQRQTDFIYAKPVVALFIACEFDPLLCYEIFNWFIYKKQKYELVAWDSYYKKAGQIRPLNPIQWAARFKQKP